MVSRAAVVILFVALLISFGVARLEPLLTLEEFRHYRLSQGAYRAAYNPQVPDALFIKYYSHLIEAHPNLENQGLQHAQLDGGGPFYVGEAQDRKALFFATQVRGDSILGRRWNLRDENEEGIVTYDAQLFWRVDRQGSKLLRLDLWPLGGQPQQTTTIQQVLGRFPRRRWGWF